jgi:hypothetical protein
MNNAIILQQAYSSDIWGTSTIQHGQGCMFYDHLALTFTRHSMYARAHHVDMQITLGNVDESLMLGMGAWAKIVLVKRAIVDYEHVFWIDADAMIFNMAADLRDALAGKAECIGAVRHPGAPPRMPPHLNVGVMYFKRDPRLAGFLDEWLSLWPGELPMLEQGIFNEMIDRHPGMVAELDNQWNATWQGVSESPHPIVRGYHGGMTPQSKLDGMRREIAALR